MMLRAHLNTGSMNDVTQNVFVVVDYRIIVISKPTYILDASANQGSA